VRCTTIPDDIHFLNYSDEAYQLEIDNLTKRAKAAENAFLNVYKVLAEAPDPYPLLEAAVVCQLAILQEFSALISYFR
jgi:homeobox protein cut-like